MGKDKPDVEWSIASMTQLNIHKSEDKEKLVIEITDDSDHEWVERIGKEHMRYAIVRLAIA